MEVDFEHEHILTFCQKSKQKFLQILLKGVDQQEERSREVEGDDDKLKNPEEVAELDDDEYPMCYVCSEVVRDGPAYFCETCDDLWLHKFCAALPRELRDHHLHSHHDNPLTLLVQKRDVIYDSSSSSNNIVPICDGCRDIIIVPNYYHCTECGLKLDCKCALSPYSDDVQQITSSLPPETKTEISHVCHHHKLFLFNLRKESCSESCACRLCDTQLLGLTYGCFNCGFFLHKSCLEIMAQELVQHPCHSHHPVFAEHVSYRFICDKCRDLCSGFMASCKECHLKIDFKCAFLVDTSNGNGVIQRSTFDGVKTQIRHFGDEFHLLSFFNCKLKTLVCDGCRLPLSGPTYGCLECSFYLHKYCAELPKEIRHPYHPFHKLYLKFSRKKPCEACGIRPRGKYSRLAYQCYECYHFLLDSLCAINSLGVISALRNKDYHPKDLYYFVAPDHLVCSRFPCDICGQNCKGSFFISMGYPTYFHIDCIGIPREIKHDCHIHTLTLSNPIMENETDESLSKMNYCFACEEPRNPKYHFYDCQQCASTGHIFTAHIECIISNELMQIEPDRMIKGDGEDGHRKYPTFFTLSDNPQCLRQLKIGDARNDHVLSYSKEGFFDFSCYICDKTMEGPGYACSYCHIKLHKECAKLPFQIKHILHEHHPLTIASRAYGKKFICDGCYVYQEHCLSYECDECDFILDLKCASAMISSNGDHYQKSNDDGSKLTISHFTHNHALTFASIAEELYILCQVCSLQILGPTYCCFRCYFFLHESCCDEPQYGVHPFHIQHPLQSKTFEANDNCKACDSKIKTRISYGCDKCEFRLHTKCFKYLTSSLQHKCHKHKLFYFVAEDIIRDESDEKQYFQCKECGKDCFESFYRCVECNISLHIECIPIPQKVKSKCHVDTLVLVDSITEDGHDECYCHACEELRNPKHAVYACKKCHYTAHIGCVLDEEDDTLEIL